MRKFLSTLRTCWCLMMARTFGTYHFSHGGPDLVTCSRYTWRGRTYDFPLDAPPSRGVFLRRRWGFKSKKQLPLFMIWEEYWGGGEVRHANIVFNSKDYIGF